LANRQRWEINRRNSRDPDNLIEVLKDEKQLREFVECFVIVAEDGTMTVLREDVVAKPMDRRDADFRQVIVAANLRAR
jgi:hypothetical protein